MGKTLRSPRPGHAHEQHLVLVRQCGRCARWVVLRGQVDHVAAFHDADTADLYAEALLEKIAGKPDPDPLQVRVVPAGHAVATGLPPAESVETPTAA